MIRFTSIIALILLIGPLFSSCSSQSPLPASGTETGVNAPSGAVQARDMDAWMCTDTALRAAQACLSSQSSAQKEAVGETVGLWSKTSGSFSALMLSTGSFSRRYSLPESERACVVKALCAPVSSEGQS